MEGKPRDIFFTSRTIKKLRLDVPQVTELAYELRKSGLDIPLGILTREELIKALAGGVQHAYHY